MEIKNNKKGMTIVEVLIALAIMSILIFIVYSVYISNLKFIDKENIKTDLQNEAQLIDSSFSQLSMQSTGVIESYTINEGNLFTDINGSYSYKSKIEDDKENNLKYKIIFSYPDDSTEDKKKYIKWILYKNTITIQPLSYKPTEKTWEDSEGGKHTLSENVDEFTIEPIGTEDLTKARVIKVNIKLKKQKGFNTVEYPIELLVNFRNKENDKTEQQ